ncbi:MAG: hypothetical protein ACOX6W_17505 [Lentisphaeria bacterium]
MTNKGLFARAFGLGLAFLASATIGWADAHRFDFAKAEAPLRKGFVRVTEKGGEKASWTAGAADIRANYTPITREWKMNIGRGRQLPPPNYPIDLTCGHVQSKEPATLALKVPAGDYRVWVLTGNGGGNYRQVWDITVASAMDKAGTTYAGSQELMDFELDAKADANGLKLDVSTRSRWVINTIIAVPKKEWIAYRDGELQAIRHECFVLPPDELAKWKETPQTSDVPEPTWTEKQKADGLAIFARPWVEPVWPDHFPRAHEINAPVRAFAAQNEYEPLTFTIHPLRNFESLQVTVGRLVNENGATLPETAIDLRYVRYMHVRPNYSTFNIYYRAPDVLMPWRGAQRLIKGENFRVWITVQVEPGTPVGIYTGEVEVKADNTTVAVPISLRVLPIHLLKDESLIYGQYYRHPYANMNAAPDDFSRSWWRRKAEAEHEDMRAIGMNTLVSSIGVTESNGRWVVNGDGFQRVVDLYRKVGFSKPIACSFNVGSIYHKYMKAGMGSHLSLLKMPPDEFFTDVTASVQAIVNEAKRREWPPILFYPIDEPSTNPLSVAFMTRIMQAIKAVPGARTYVTADPAHEQFAPMRPFVDVWCCQPFTFPKDFIERDMAENPGLEYWCYPNHISGENDHTPTKGARMTYGFGFWNSGFRCLIPWIYQSSGGSQWNYLDSSSSDFVNRTDVDGTPIPVTLWVAYREGLDDGRYLNTLEKWIAAAEEAGFTAEAQAARDDIELIRSSINVQTKYKIDGLWGAETFDVYRWLLAQRIMDLKNLF